MAWPTHNNLIDRMTVTRGLAVLLDPEQGWITSYTPWLGTILDNGLIEGETLFYGGHNYDVDDDTYAALESAGLVSGTDVWPNEELYPSEDLYPFGA